MSGLRSGFGASFVAPMGGVSAPCRRRQGTQTRGLRLGRQGGHTQRGIALAVVVWFLAGMSLLVAGVVFSARTDVRLAQVHIARAQVTSAGDGAINLLMADITENILKADNGALLQARYVVGDDTVTVHAVPSGALLDVTRASAAELAAAASASGRVPGGDAMGLARAVVQYRESPNRRARIDSIEDLLGANGVNRAALDALRDYVVVGQTSRLALVSNKQPDKPNAQFQSRVSVLQNWAPEGRAKHPELLARARLPEDAVSGDARGYRVDALVRRDRDVWLRRRWVGSGGGRGSGLPWSFSRTEPVRMVPRA